MIRGLEWSFPPPTSWEMGRSWRWNQLPTGKDSIRFPRWLSGKRICLPMQETRDTVQSQGSLEKEMANCSSILAWKFSWAEETGGLHSMRPQMLDMTEHACKDSNNPSYVINPAKNGIHQNFRLVNMWRCCDGSIPGEPCASLSSDYS